MEENTYGMKWYNFVVKIQLWLAMFFLLANGCMTIQGEQYSNKEAVYSAFPKMRTIDIGYGLILLSLIAVAFITRRYLARFDERGPKYYIGLCVIITVLPIIYAAVCSAANSVPISYLINEGTIVTAIIMIVHTVCNYIYFKKRKQQFTVMGLQSVSNNHL